MSEVSDKQREEDVIFTRAILDKLTPEALATLAKPMGLALVPVKPERDAIFKGAEQLTPNTCTSVSRDDAHKVYKAMIEAGRIKPKLDKCEICHGAMGGVRGNEQNVDGVLMCDYCHSDTMGPAKQAERKDDE